MSGDLNRGNRLVARWEQFWFQAVPADVYALLRIAFGLLGLAMVLEFTPVSMFWAIDGIAPVPGGGVGIRSQLLAMGLSTAAGWTYFSILVIAFALMTVGFLSRVSVPISFFGAAFMISWNRLPLSAANEVLAAILFCLVWADCGGAPSVDAWLAARRRGADPNVRQPDAAIWPLRLIRFQVCLIYFNSGLWKFVNTVWRDGTAVHYATSLNVFHRFPFTVPPAFDWMTTVATYLTLVWEIGFPLFMFNRITRRAALIVGVLMHAGMYTMLEVGAFSWVMIATYLAFLDPVSVAGFMRRRLGYSQSPVVPVRTEA